MSIADLLLDLKLSPTAFNAVARMSDKLLAAGFKELKESEHYHIEGGHNYFIRRNASSILAFRLPPDSEGARLKIVATHTDCPSFKLKPHALLNTGKYAHLNVEVYGGAIYSTWLDRPLSLAGRLVYKDQGQIKTKIFDLKEAFCLIPNVAIHLSNSNNGYKYNPQIDLLPLVSDDPNFDFLQFLAKKSGLAEILNYDLYLYPLVPFYQWQDYFSAFHIDNLECAYIALAAFLKRYDPHNINIYCAFDNEEVGSLTRQGADSDFLANNLLRLCEALNLDYPQTLARSFMVSADNAHGLHPNHPELADPNNTPLLNQGIVIKYNANQSYTSDAYSAAVFKEILAKVQVPWQYYTNRSDIRGGRTLGNIANSHVSLLTVDIGLAQLAMHSAYESAGIKDVNYLFEGLKAFYQDDLALLADSL